MMERDVPDVLRRILQRKLEEIAERREQVSLSDLESRLDRIDPVRGFRAQLETRIASGWPAVIAEIKRASPSKGLLRENFQPDMIARSYAEGGAACLSVLTDTDFFQGADTHLQMARSACELPVLRKDFVLDEYQIVEARALGADCVLLIVAALEQPQLRRLHECAADLGMDVLVEVHDQFEMERALELHPRLLGINNRDLRNFETRLETTLQLLDGIRYAPDAPLLVTESGIHSAEDVRLMRQAGVNAFLVGEAFMRREDPGAGIQELFGEIPPAVGDHRLQAGGPLTAG